MLSLYKLLRLRLLHNIFHQRVRVTDCPGHHARDGILILADYAHHLEFKAVFIERPQSQLFFGQVNVCPRLLIQRILIGRENVAEAFAAQFFVAPALALVFYCLLGNKKPAYLR